jgi:hypothetical protein
MGEWDAAHVHDRGSRERSAQNSRSPGRAARNCQLHQRRRLIAAKIFCGEFLPIYLHRLPYQFPRDLVGLVMRQTPIELKRQLGTMRSAGNFESRLWTVARAIILSIAERSGINELNLVSRRVGRLQSLP